MSVQGSTLTPISVQGSTPATMSTQERDVTDGPKLGQLLKGLHLGSTLHPLYLWAVLGLFHLKSSACFLSWACRLGVVPRV